MEDKEIKAKDITLEEVEEIFNDEPIDVSSFTNDRIKEIKEELKNQKQR